MNSPAPGGVPVTAQHGIPWRPAWRRLENLWERPLVSLHLVTATFGLLTGLGLVMVLAASSVESFQKTGDPYAVFERQLVSCVIGLVLFGVGVGVPTRWLRLVSPYLLIVALLLLVAVLVPGLGSEALGARKWFVVGGLSLQPSELAKPALVLWGAHVLALPRRTRGGWRPVLVAVVPVALVAATLVVLEPDLGTTLCVGIALFALLYFAAAPARLLAALAGGALVAVVVLSLGASYRLSRVTSFLNTDTTDAQGAGYQARQALYSLADGGLLGTGLGQGTASWSYLPNASTDFIFAIVGEELGFAGAVAVLGLFALVGVVGLRIAARTADPFARIAAATLATLVVGQAFINVGYVVGLLPVTGIPLPLISVGGNSVEVTMFAFGLLANFARHEPAAQVALAGSARTAHRIGTLLTDVHRRLRM